VKEQESVIHKNQNDEVLEKLRSFMVEDVIRIKSLEVENKKLKDKGSKKDQLIDKLLKEAEESRSLMDEGIGEIVEKKTRFILRIKRLWQPSELNPSPYLKILRVELRVYSIGS
jgi:hypothetical protein